MKYMGSKARIAKHILPIILSGRRDGQFYVEPFLGGANSMQFVDGNRAAGEKNVYIAEMWNYLINGWIPPRFVSKDEYVAIRENKDSYPRHLVGYVGVCCSYSGKWFGGYAGIVNTKMGIRDYQSEAFSNVMKQVVNLHGLVVSPVSYDQLSIPDDSIIYCDPPYQGTTGYKFEFDHTKFWQWCRDMATLGHMVYISEYSAPDDFICVWEMGVKSSLSANGKTGSSKDSVEKLFTYKVDTE